MNILTNVNQGRPVIPGCAGCAMAHPDFGRSINPISTRGDRLCPPNYYWHTRIFRPSDGPVVNINYDTFLKYELTLRNVEKVIFFPSFNSFLISFHFETIRNQEYELFP